METAVSYMVTSDSSMPGPASKISNVSDNLMNHFSPTLTTWYSSGYHTSTADNFFANFQKFLLENDYLGTSDPMRDYITCLWDSDFASLCTSNYDNLTGDDKASATSMRAILSQDGITKQMNLLAVVHSVLLTKWML